jgi:hypothetical protein
MAVTPNPACALLKEDSLMILLYLSRCLLTYDSKLSDG